MSKNTPFEKLKSSRADAAHTVPAGGNTLSWLEISKFYLWLLGKHRKVFLFGLASIFTLNFYQLVPPLILGAMINVLALPGDHRSQVLNYAMLLGASYATVALLRLSAKALVTKKRNDIGYRIRVTGFERLLRNTLDSSRALTGSGAQQIVTGVSDFYEFTRLLSNEIFRVITGLTGSLVLFSLMQGSFIVFPLVYVSVFFLLANTFSKKFAVLNVKLAKAVESSTGAMVDSLGNALTIHSHGVREEFTDFVAARAAEVQQYEQTIRDTSIRQWKLFQLLNALTLSLFLFAVGNSVLSGALLVGTVVTFFGYMQTLVYNCTDLLDVWENLQKYRAGLIRLHVVLGGGVSRSRDREELAKWREIQLESVSFAYERETGGSKMIFDNISLRIGRGERIGLIGESGAGKTTLAKLLIGLYRPQQGRIVIDGIDLSEIDLDAVSDEFAVALQECEIFGLTLRENITLMRDVDEPTLKGILKTAGLTQLVERLPEGLETLVGERGYRLSGGERQRVSLARALCKRPSLLILDEATVMLDENTERTVLDALYDYLPNTTFIVIAHHERTLKHVNRILSVRNSRIENIGLPAALDDAGRAFSA